MQDQSVVEGRYQFRQVLDQVHRPGRHDPAQAPAGNETTLNEDWTIAIPAAAPALLLNAAKDLQDYLLVSMNISVPVQRTDDPANFAQKTKNGILLATSAELPALGHDLEVCKSYRLTIGSNHIVICGFDDRGAAQGAIYLEDLMNMREAPFLQQQDEVRKPLFSPRMIHSGWGIDQYPDKHLNALLHAGFDAILLFVEAPDETPTGHVDFSDLISRAGAIGLDVYFYSYLKSLKHPDDEDALEFYRAGYGELFRRYNAAKGIILVGESCEFPSHDPQTTGKLRRDMSEQELQSGKPSPGWWPCRDYPQWLNMIKRVVREQKADADIVFWTYNWGYAPEEERLRLIRDLPQDISLQVTFEMFEQIPHEDVTHVCVDYTISFPGPGSYFKSEAAAAAERGLKLYTMSNTAGLTWDFGVVPYIPVPAQWMCRNQALHTARRDWGLSGLMESHHYGCWPSFISDLAKWSFWEPSPPPETILAQLARRDFGASAVSSVLQAWKLWSAAINDYIPTNEDQYGPCRVGPAYPFILHPHITKTFDSQELSIPTAPYAHFGSRIVKTFYHPFEDPRQSPGPLRMPVEIRSLQKMLEKWQQGLDVMASILPAVPELKKAPAERQFTVALFIRHILQSALNIKRWWQVNSKLMTAETRAEMNALLDELMQIGNAEIANAAAAIPPAESNSRLGWEPSMEYIADRDHIEWKICQLQHVLKVQIPCYRASINL